MENRDRFAIAATSLQPTSSQPVPTARHILRVQSTQFSHGRSNSCQSSITSLPAVFVAIRCFILSICSGKK
uniref:Uncharacterized protein n=1 Tax=Ixodes ricinus TaxID=34613 RepID=A0A6B0U1L3_IXORI